MKEHNRNRNKNNRSYKEIRKKEWRLNKTKVEKKTMKVGQKNRTEVK